ncbi:MAG: glycosyltransferase [Nitrospiraceae bacterium]|nr:MAG: glycosyltransferase [Nitrospiraceae bacterium]
MLSDRKKEITALRETIAGKDRELSALKAELTQIHNSLTWKILRKYDTVLGRLLPEKTGRRALYDRFLGTLGILLKKRWCWPRHQATERQGPQTGTIRLMVVIHSMEMGGAERCTSVLLEHIERSFITPELVLIFDREAFYQVPGDVKVLVLEKQPAPSVTTTDILLPPHLQKYSNSLAWMEMTAAKLAAAVKEQQPHVVLAQGYFAANIALLAKKHIPGPIRLIASAHCNLSPEKIGDLHAFLIQTLFKNADCVVAVSGEVARELKSIPGMRQEKVVTIFNPLDFNQIQSLSRERLTEHRWFSEDIPIILFVGRLARVKGVDYLLRALSIVRNSAKVRCVLIGEGEEGENLRQLAEESDIAEDVLFLGRQRNPFKFMRMASIFVLPSLTEGLPYALVEALACGCPIIATNSPGGGSAEILKDGEYGLLVPPGDENALADAVIKLLKDDKLRDKFSALALQRAGDFGLKSSMEAYQNIFLADSDRFLPGNVEELTGEELRDDRTRVMVFIHSMATGGAERCISVLLNNFSRSKITAELVTVYDNEMCYAIPDDVKIHILEKQPGPVTAPSSDFSLPPHLKAFANDFVWLKTVAVKLSGVIQKRRPSVVLAQDFFASVILLLAQKHVPPSTKLIVSARCMLSMFLPTKKEGELYAFLVQALFNNADHVIANGSGVAEDLKMTFGVKNDKVSVIYNSVNPVQLRYLSDETVDHGWFHEDIPVLLYTGWLTTYKGVDHLLKALSLVKDSIRVRCVLIGEGEEKEKLRQLAGELGLTENVLFLGRQMNPFKFMRRSTIFVLPSLTEGSPNVLLEAFACGCPVIATDTPGGASAEILKNGKYGLLVPPGDPKALSEAILKLLNDAGLRQRLSRLAIQQVKGFDVGSSVDAYEHLFLKGLKEHTADNHEDNKTRVMMVIPTMGMGGAERCMSVLLNNVNRSVFRPELVTIFDKAAFYRVPEDVNMYVLETQPRPSIPDSCLLLPADLQGFDDNYKWLRMTAFRLAKIIRDRRPSTIMAQDYFASFIVLLAKEYVPRNIRLIISAHNSPSGLFATASAGELYTFFTKRLFNEADHIISVSEGVTGELQTDFGTESEKIMTLHNPVDLVQIQSMAEEKITGHAWFDDDIPVALFVGGLAPRKGLVYFLKALSIIKKSVKLRCVLIGEGEEKEKLQQLAGELGITEDVVFSGRQQNPFKFMKRSTMFVLPSLTEGLPYVLVEALACGCSIIATDSPGGGPSEILKNGECGLLVPPADEKALAEAMLKLLHDNELRQKLSGLALQRAGDFGLESSMKAYENLFL